MPGRPLDAYKTAWGTTEQPTTITSVASTAFYGNRIKFNVAGQVVGMRWGRIENVNDNGGVGVCWALGPVRHPIRSCQWGRRIGIGAVTFVWDNAFFHHFLRVSAGQIYMFEVAPLASPIHYNDGQLVAGPYTSTLFTWPQDANPDRNGAS